MGRLYEIALAIALLGVALNIIALLLHLLGVDIVGIDPGLYPG